MNSQKLHIQTVMKFFFFIICAFSGKVAISQSVVETEGSWMATIRDNKISIQFKRDNNSLNSSHSSTFLLSEFSTPPKGQNTGFKLVREAGIILFTGKFEGDEGTGRYKFIPDKEYSDYMQTEGLIKMNEQDLFTFFQLNITKAYVKVFRENGYAITKNELIPLAALKVDESYIRFWKENGYKNISAADLIPMKSLDISAGYVKGFQDLGYHNLSASDLITMKSLSINSNYIKSFQALEFKNIPVSLFTPLKSLGVTADYVKGFLDLGFTNIDLNDMIPLKSTGVTPEFVSSMKKKGFDFKSLNKYMQLKNLQD